MKIIQTRAAWCFALLAFSLGWCGAYAQETQTKTATKKVTVTGCLQKGDEAGEYSITGEDGKKYGLRSKSVDLSKHLGHKVTVIGMKMHEASEGKEAKETGGAEEADLRVSSLKMVSEACQ